MMKKLFAAFIVFMASAVFAQALTHSVTLNWVDANNPVGTTYNVYKATGLCSGTPVFSQLVTGVAAKTYNDATVAPGSYCYKVTAVVASLEGGPSNTINPAVLPFAVTLSFTVQ